MSPADYCAARVRAAGGDGALLARFAPPPLRPATLALAALRAELDHLVEHRPDPSVVGPKLAWWRQELAALGVAPGQHPATQALAEQAAAPLALRDALLDLVDAAETELAGRSALPRAAWRAHLLRRGDGWLMALESLGGSPRAARDELGVALATIEALGELGLRLRRSQPAHALEDGPGPGATDRDAGALRWVTREAERCLPALAPRGAEQALPVLLEINRALGARRARALFADPALAWRPAPRHSLGALFCAWRAARR